MKNQDQVKGEKSTAAPSVVVPKDSLESADLSKQSREYQEAAQREEELRSINSQHNRVLALMSWKLTDEGGAKSQ